MPLGVRCHFGCFILVPSWKIQVFFVIYPFQVGLSSFSGDLEATNSRPRRTGACTSTIYLISIWNDSKCRSHFNNFKTQQWGNTTFRETASQTDQQTFKTFWQNPLMSTACFKSWFCSTAGDICISQGQRGEDAWGTDSSAQDGKERQEPGAFGKSFVVFWKKIRFHVSGNHGNISIYLFCFHTTDRSYLIMSDTSYIIFYLWLYHQIFDIYPTLPGCPRSQAVFAGDGGSCWSVLRKISQCSKPGPLWARHRGRQNLDGTWPGLATGAASGVQDYTGLWDGTLASDAHGVDAIHAERSWRKPNNCRICTTPGHVFGDWVDQCRCWTVVHAEDCNQRLWKSGNISCMEHNMSILILSRRRGQPNDPEDFFFMFFAWFSLTKVIPSPSWWIKQLTETW